MGLFDLIIDVVTLPVAVASDILNVATGEAPLDTVEKIKDIGADVVDTLL